jgi:hypothetical protein
MPPLLGAAPALSMALKIEVAQRLLLVPRMVTL